jgi:hypothetical protein
MRSTASGAAIGRSAADRRSRLAPLFFLPAVVLATPGAEVYSAAGPYTAARRGNFKAGVHCWALVGSANAVVDNITGESDIIRKMASLFSTRVILLVLSVF